MGENGLLLHSKLVECGVLKDPATCGLDGLTPFQILLAFRLIFLFYIDCADAVLIHFELWVDSEETLLLNQLVQGIVDSQIKLV